MVKIIAGLISMRCKLLFTIFLGLLLLSNTYAKAVLTTIDGKTMSFTSLRGKWVFINYWASWCQPCLDEIPTLNKFYRLHQDNIALFAVNFDFLPVADQLALIKELNIHYPALIKNPGEQLGLEEPRGVPVTFVFNPEGNLADTLYGGQTLHSLQKVIKG